MNIISRNINRLYSYIFYTVFLFLLSSFLSSEVLAIPPDVPASNTQIIKLKKNAIIRGPWYHTLGSHRYINMQWTYTVYVEEPDGSSKVLCKYTDEAEQYEPQYKYVAQRDGDTLTLWVELKKPDGTIIYPRNCNDPGTVIFSTAGSTCDEIAEHIIQVDWKFGTDGDITLHLEQVACELRVHYIPMETTIFQNNWAQYPEVALVTFVAVNADYVINGDAPDKLWKFGKIKIDMKRNEVKVRESLNSHLALLTPFSDSGNETFLFANLPGPDGIDFAEQAENPYYNALNWQGFFYAYRDEESEGGCSLKNLFGSPNINITNGHADQPHGYDPEGVLNKDLTFYLGGNNPSVVAVKSWNYEPMERSHMGIIITTTSSDYPVTIEGTKSNSTTISVKLNIDNVRLIRENYMDPSTYIVGYPKLPIIKHPFKDPGNFIMHLGAHTFDTAYTPGYPIVAPATLRYGDYRNIGNVLVDIETFKIPANATMGNGARDWLEVAAADIYNNPDNDEVKRVFDCVWEIKTHDRGFDDAIGLGGKFYVSLREDLAIMRFNTSSFNSYGFAYRTTRDNVAYHESLHSYMQLPGFGISDWDKDRLYIGGYFYDGESMRCPNIVFSEDSKARGFQKKNPLGGTSIYEQWQEPLGGDRHYNRNYEGAYFMRIDDKIPDPIELFNPAIPHGLFEISSPMPPDLPFDLFRMAGYDGRFNIYLYNQDTKEEREIARNSSPMLELVRSRVRSIWEGYGYYYGANHKIEVDSFQSRDWELYDLMTEDSNWQIWAEFYFRYPKVGKGSVSVNEYDCSLFGITHGEIKW